MILDKVFERFAQQTPLTVMARGLLENVLNPTVVDQLFEDVAEKNLKGSGTDMAIRFLTPLNSRPIDLMADLTYSTSVSTANEPPKPLFWLHGEIKTPPFSEAARLEAGELLRELQNHEMIGMPHSRPMPSIGARCHELRIKDENRA